VSPRLQRAIGKPARHPGRMNRVPGVSPAPSFPAARKCLRRERRKRLSNRVRRAARRRVNWASVARGRHAGCPLAILGDGQFELVFVLTRDRRRVVVR